MTARNANKTSARAIASLSGMPYQSCLTAVEVLRHLPGSIDIGDLGRLLSHAHSRYAVLNLPGEADGRYEALFSGPCGPLNDSADIVVVAGSRVPVLLGRLDSNRLGATSESANLWAELYISDDVLRPAGIWRFSAARLHEAMGESDGNVATVLAEQAGDATGFPDFFAAGETPRVAYMSDRLMTAPPSYTTPGPGFDWGHFRFSDLDQVHGPGEVDHRLESCTGRGCGWLHDWPTADPRHTQVVFPMPLLEAYRTVILASGYEGDDFSAEQSYMHAVADDGSRWFGLDTPHQSDLMALWMQVEYSPDCTESALPVVS